MEIVRGADVADTDVEKAEKVLQLINRILSLRPTLFSSVFRSELASAVLDSVHRCESAFREGDEGGRLR